MRHTLWTTPSTTAIGELAVVQARRPDRAAYSGPSAESANDAVSGFWIGPAVSAGADHAGFLRCGKPASTVVDRSDGSGRGPGTGVFAEVPVVRQLSTACRLARYSGDGLASAVAGCCWDSSGSLPDSSRWRCTILQADCCQQIAVRSHCSPRFASSDAGHRSRRLPHRNLADPAELQGSTVAASAYQIGYQVRVADLQWRWRPGHGCQWPWLDGGLPDRWRLD